MTLKQFFSRNHEQLAAELQLANQTLKQEVESLAVLNMITAEISSSQLAQGYRQRR
jgi:hypothetical protein